ncbi:MAG: GNAT family N-acetyltransferase [Actinomycetota bacterium]
MSTIIVRSRADADGPALGALAAVVQERDGYPPHLPGDEAGAFILDGEPLAAWVATDGDAVVGHVALHDHSSPGVLDLVADGVGVAPDGCGVVARLFVTPDLRRSGLGRRLLDIAVAECRRLGLLPVLDVVDRFEAAIALYEHVGWRRLGAVEFDIGDDRMLREYVYVLDPPA